MNVLTVGSQALIVATIGTLFICWFVSAFTEWIAYAFKQVFRG